VPLPTGAATEVTLAAIDAKLGASLPLPTGAATSANQVTANASLAAIDTKLGGTLAVSGPLTDAQLRASAVPVSAASLPLPSGAATETTLSSIDTRLNVMDDWDESDRAKVNIIAGQAGVTGGSGAADAATQRVALATDANTVKQAAHTSGGATPYKLISAATTNATSVKASAGQVYGIQVFNSNAAIRYLKLYDKASAPTVGTDVPVKVIAIPGNTAGAGVVAPISIGAAFSNGIAFALTTGAADSDTGAVAANEIIVNLDYK
jgi:hypothetical protein